MLRWIGLDIGGANIKAADSRDQANSMPFAMWKSPDELAQAVVELVEPFSEFDAVALTMTGEMADCFATREEGVCRILEQVTRIIPSRMIRVYSIDGRWMNVPQAARSAWNVASSNWMALSQYSIRWTDGQQSLVIDIGSTTTDILAIDSNKVKTASKTDRDRLIAGELVYTGIERSSVVNIVREVPVHGDLCPVMNELFATTADVNLLLGFTDENPNDTDTADGKPKTRSCAQYRLARIVGEDGATLGRQDVEAIAESIYDEQVSMIASAMKKVASPLKKSKPDLILVTGHGDFLISDAIHRLKWKVETVQLSKRIDPLIARCAPAHAIAVLASEQIDAL